MIKQSKLNIMKKSDANILRQKSYKYKFNKTKEYWTEETIIKELKLIIDEIEHFPKEKELRQMNKSDLNNTIIKNGGLNYFREKMGYDYVRKPKGYWTEEIIIKELKLIIKEISYFPNGNKLQQINKYDLAVAIERNGGYIYFKKKCGFTVSMQEKYRSELMSYINKRGNNSEQFVKKIINEWSMNNNKSCPDFNVKLTPGNVIEFVCDSNKRIGIDVTNTKASKSGAYNVIQRKWKKKDYCLHLDELWIVIFSDILKSKHYSELNEISPDNVKVFSIYDFITELDYSTEYWNKDKIDRLNDCSFHTKDELIDMSRPVIGWL